MRTDLDTLSKQVLVNSNNHTHLGFVLDERQLMAKYLHAVLAEVNSASLIALNL